MNCSLVSFLRSKAVEIREAARASLAGVVELLGPRYLSFVLRELAAGLTRGYQLHILTFTSHSLLVRLQDSKLLQPGDLDPVLAQVIQYIQPDPAGFIFSETLQCFVRSPALR